MLTFALDGRGTLPPAPVVVARAVEDSAFRADPARALRAEGLFARSCAICHGVDAMAAGGAPDLRTSVVPLNPAAFANVVRDGALVPRGMPRYEEFTDEELSDLAFYIRTQAAKLRSAQQEASTSGASPKAGAADPANP